MNADIANHDRIRFSTSVFQFVGASAQIRGDWFYGSLTLSVRIQHDLFGDHEDLRYA